MRGQVDRILRAIIVAGLASVAAATGAGATSNVHVDGLSAFLVSAGSKISITGHGFTQYGNGTDCTIGTAPKVLFYHLSGPNQVDPPVSVDPITSDSSNCSDTTVNVNVPNLGDAARVAVQEGGGTTSNSNLEITFPSTVGGINPSSGPVGTPRFTISGSNLKPPTLAPNSNLSISCGALNSWSNTSVVINPQNSSCAANLGFKVSIDASNPSNTQSVALSAPGYVFLAPSLNGGPLPSSAVGQRITLGGQYLGSSGTVFFNGGAAGQGTSWGSTSIQTTIPQGAQPGAISITVGGYSGRINEPNGPPTINLNPTINGLSPSSGSVGQAVTVSGYNLGSTGNIMVGGANEPVSNWSDRAVTFNISSDTDTGPVKLSRSDGVSLVAGTFTVLPRINRIETPSVPVGAQLVIDGASLGANPGTVNVAGQKIKADLWSRTSILVTLPPSIGPGHYSLGVSSASGTASNTLALVVVAAPSPSPGSTPSTGPRPSPVYDLSHHNFIKPAKTGGPVDLTVTLDPHSVDAGGTASVTVLLKLNGKPVQGAEVKLSMAATPGDDFSFTPDSGTTDADGVFKSTVRVSKTAGDTVVLAQSGTFTDEDAVTGKAQATSAGGDTGGGSGPGAATRNPAASSALLPLAALGGVAALLLGLGLFLNLRSHRG
ncbi:MAG: IPT/TIG domain-containing protein [Candidatus Dormibacteria bacterium]